jgi:hypothetical protein
MPNIKGPESALPVRPFSAHLDEHVTLLGNVFEELGLHSLDVSTPLTWGSAGAAVEHCYVRMQTKHGTVEAKRPTFAKAFLACVAALEVLLPADDS